MKKIIIFAILLVSIYTKSTGQPPMGSVNYRPDLDKFIGTWRWTDGGNNELILKLKKVMYHSDGINNKDYYEEILLAGWKYTKNGIVIEDNLAVFPLLGPDRIEGTLFSLLKPNIVRSLFEDRLLNKTENLRLTYDATATPPTLVWRLRNVGKTYMQGQTPPDDNITLPKNSILIKQP